uniref:Reverse transcriptase n=1 Tax=Phytophthora ramorum TaxID=164328 RepID=H3GRH5_PHYRM
MDEQPMQHGDSMQQLFASLAAMMHEQQQQFMAQTADLQRQMAATLQQQQAPPQQQQQQQSESPAVDTREYRAEGITMPKFSGTKEDDVGDYMFSAKLYFESKNIKYGSEAPQQRPLSLLVANLKGPAAAWYREYVFHDGHFLHSVTQFEEFLTSEFTAPDRQEHLRNQLLRLRQRNCSCLEDYVATFRGLICKVEDMSDIDKVMHFQKGLLTDIKQEVKLRQFRTTTEAISFALMYDRTHFVSSRQLGRTGHQSSQCRSSPQPRQRMEEQPTPMEIGNARIISRQECMRRNLCLYCKEPGHRLADCRKRQARNSPRGPSRPPHGRSSFRANQSSFRCVVEAQDDSDDEEDFVDDNDNLVEVIDSLQLMVSVDSVAPSKRELLRFEGMMNDQVVRVLIDSGAERNIVRPGLAQHFVDAAKVTAERFDGTTTPARTVHRCCETLSFDGREFADVSLIEWEVSSNQVVILGHPWLVQFNPIINCQTGVMRFPRPRLVLDARSINDSLDVAPPTVAAVEVTSELLQHPLPSNLRQQLNDHIKAGYFHMPLGPSSIASLGCRPSPHGSGKDGDNQAATPLCVISAAQFATKVKAEEYVELYHVTVEQEALDIFVAELLKKNWIEVSDSPWVSNIFGMPKKDPSTGKFPSRPEWLHSNNPHMAIRWVIDYRLVNAASEVAKIPLPYIEHLFDRMNVAPMGLARIPGSWTRLMRKVLSHLAFVVVYLDDICIFWRSMADHVEHLQRVCEVLRQHKLYARPDKCDFGQRSVDFLSHTISVDGLHVDARKTRAIAEWMEPSNIKDHQRFVGLAGYYRRFIHRFATLVLPLSALVKKDVPWAWDDTQRQAFNAIKLALQHAPPATELHDVGTAQLRMRVHAVSTAGSTVTKKAFQKAYDRDPEFKHLWKYGRTSEEYEVVHGLVYLKSNDNLRRFCVPNNRKLRVDVIHNAHDAAIMAHPGIRRTQLAAAQWYFWPSMDLDIKAYVQKDTAKLFFNNVIRYYGIPSTITSDRDTKFTSRFWTVLVNLMKIKAAITTAHRAQADGQTERQNRTLEESLRCSISYHGNDWNEHLPMIEYAHATLVSSSSKLSPFFVDTGRKPTYLLDTGADAASVPHSRVEHASRFVQHRQEVIERARKNLLDAHATQKKFYDKRRAENPFKVGDLALLSTQDLKISHATAETTLRSRKFIPRFIGPYAILEIRGNVALLDLPANLKSLSPRFNIDKLKVYTSNPDRFDGRMISKSTPVIFDDDGEPLHVVEALIKRRTFNRQPEYLVKWYGLPHHENTWERERDIKHVSRWQALLKDLCRRSQARACGILFMRGFPVMFLTTRDYGTTNFNFDDFILKQMRWISLETFTS